MTVAGPPRTHAALDLAASESDGDLVGRIAAEIGSPGAELRTMAAGSRWRLYLPQGDPAAWSARVRELWIEWAPAGGPPAATPDLVEEPERDWSDEARRGFGGTVIGPFWIGPPWLDPPAGLTPVRILPGRAFGTGLHATTRLALRLLALHTPGVARVLDVGTGSGVLALAALARGARRAVGVDVDPHALANAAENAGLNERGGRLRLTAGSADAFGPAARFDLVLANLEAAPLVRMLETLGRILGPAGTLVVSGITAGQRSAFLAAACGRGLVPVEETEEEGWWAAALRRA